MCTPSEEAGRKDWKAITTIYPEDVNRQQTFELPTLDTELLRDGVSALKFIFQESSDFFGRITVYDLKLEGLQVA